MLGILDIEPREDDIACFYFKPESNSNITSGCSKTDKSHRSIYPLLSKVLLYTQEGWPTQCSEISCELQPYYRRRLQITVEAGCGVCMLLLYLFHAKNLF